MNHQLTGLKAIQKCTVEEIAATVLYEGYILYPYRASAIKNQHRFNFGTLPPKLKTLTKQEATNCAMRTECLVVGEAARLRLRVRFLHPMSRKIGKLKTSADAFDSAAPPEYEIVASMSIRGNILQTWQEVIEREIDINDLSVCSLVGHSHPTEFTFAGCYQIEPLEEADGSVVGMILRQQVPVIGRIDVSAELVSPELIRLSVEVRNETLLEEGAESDREALMLRSLASTHTILELTDGKFISLLETPSKYSAAAAQCNNQGCWPVLIGQPGDQSTMLSSPIILYDYPQIAAESDGDFFDGCEIDEMLALRVMTLTDDEKRQMRGVDDRARAILDRTDSRPEEYLMKLHGSMRKPVE